MHAPRVGGVDERFYRGKVSAAVARRGRTRMAARRRRSVPSSPRGNKTTVVEPSRHYFAASSPSGTGSNRTGGAGGVAKELAHPGAWPRAH